MDENLVWAVRALAKDTGYIVNITGDTIKLEPDWIGEEVYKDIIDHLNLKVNGSYKYSTPATKKLITKLIKSDFTIEQIKLVISYKASQWLNDNKMRIYLRPATLFNFNKFEGYLAQARLEAGSKDMFDLLKDDWNE